MWREISTLPESAMEAQLPGGDIAFGKSVLLRCVDYDNIAVVFDAFWSVDDEVWYVPDPQDGKQGGRVDLHRWEPTHWMPLPEPPQ